MLTRDAILSAEDLQTEVVEVPEWGGSVTVRELTGTERDEYESSMVVQKGDAMIVNPINMRAKLAAMTLVDDNGKLMFTMKDIQKLGQKSASALDRIVDVARRISGMESDSVEQAGKG